jgi:nucleotide-binding universal stress UspA family protein
MRYVVGYTADRHGRDAVNLAATLAVSRGASLDIVVVLPVETVTYDMYSPDRSYYARLEAHGREWLAQAMDGLPQDVKATGRIYHAESIAEGLIQAATDPARGSEAALIAIGASRRGVLGRFTVGSIADALLHSAPVPVALAPAGYPGYPAITRITTALGERQGAEALLEVAIDSAAGRRVPLRLISLLSLDTSGTEEEQAVFARAETHATSLVEQARAALPSECAVTRAIGKGRSVEEAVQVLEFVADEMVLVGSSRLASPKRLFIGAAANKMLRALPVPMIVVPRDYAVPAEAKDAILSEKNQTY